MNQFERDVKGKLLSLSEKQRSVFAFLTVDKLYPHYVVFQEKYDWGDSDLLFHGIELIYNYIVDDLDLSNVEIEDMISRVDDIIPDMDNFGSALSSFALNASTGVQCALRYLIDNNIEHITDIVSFTLDTVDLFIQDKENHNTLDPSRDIQIEHDSFMIQEQRRELEIIEKLSTLQTDLITKELITSLRSNIPIIDLSLLSDAGF
ncbi:DUF416 family protein [Mucilaginibacter agri]|uniref:DUF416 family protein n=1 Tax=Mucilaginibacter agri TaxID=2695265 RepID=A0A966DRR1_9SPHI|nr:DUF416 family protein [Mucilaginibacter agri]NCD68755.1 DUF416 family protein [Mucilaginibacter agri]